MVIIALWTRQRTALRSVPWGGTDQVLEKTASRRKNPSANHHQIRRNRQYQNSKKYQAAVASPYMSEFDINREFLFIFSSTCAADSASVS